MYIDTHTHIYEEEFREDREEAVQRAKEAGIKYMILPDIDSESRQRMLDTEAQYPEMMFPLAGLHPTSVHENYPEELKAVEKWLGEHRFYGIGECGIDLYWDKTYYREQIKVFEYQLEIARDMHLPVIIHSREALDLIFEILKKHPYTGGILHCFPGNAEDARLACDLGFLIGVGGIVTFKKGNLADVVRSVSLSSLVLETDAPYLAPIPHRGKRNESSYIPLIAAKIAELTERDISQVAEVTTRNAMNLFKLS